MCHCRFEGAGYSLTGTKEVLTSIASDVLVAEGEVVNAVEVFLYPNKMLQLKMLGPNITLRGIWSGGDSRTDDSRRYTLLIQDGPSTGRGYLLVDATDRIDRITLQGVARGVARYNLEFRQK